MSDSSSHALHIPQLKPVRALRKGYKDTSARAPESARAREPVRECGLIQADESEWPHTTRPRYKEREWPQDLDTTRPRYKDSLESLA